MKNYYGVKMMGKRELEDKILLIDEYIAKQEQNMKSSQDLLESLQNKHTLIGDEVKQNFNDIEFQQKNIKMFLNRIKMKQEEKKEYLKQLEIIEKRPKTLYEEKFGY
jgi:hypothetical protein